MLGILYWLPFGQVHEHVALPKVTIATKIQTIHNYSDLTHGTYLGQENDNFLV